MDAAAHYENEIAWVACDRVPQNPALDVGKLTVAAVCGHPGAAA